MALDMQERHAFEHEEGRSPVWIGMAWGAVGEFNAEIFRDGINADRVGKDYKREVIRVSANKKLNLHMAPGGGFVVRITK